MGEADRFDPHYFGGVGEPDMNEYSVQMHIDHMAQLSDAAAISRAMAEDDDPVIVEPELIIRVLAAAEKYELIEWREGPS